MNLDDLRNAGFINKLAIHFGFGLARIGTSLKYIDDSIGELLKDANCTPVFKNYRGYPANVCLSPNDTVVHGIPNDYTLREGDILTIDMGTDYRGAKTDSAMTAIISELEDDQIMQKYCDDIRLVDGTRAILESQLSVIKNNCTLLDIALIGEQTALKFNINIFPQFGGHAIGEQLHMEPFIANTIDRKISPLKQKIEEQKLAAYSLKTDQIICIEPVTTLGKTDTILMQDGWTIKTQDHSKVAHFEHCIRVLENGYEVIC